MSQKARFLNNPKKCNGLARYLAKYVASPPIAVSRIVEYDCEAVTYWYRDHKSKAKKVETIPVFTFIGRMVRNHQGRNTRKDIVMLQAVKSLLFASIVLE